MQTLILYIGLVGFLTFHPFHVSVTEMEHNPKEQTLEIAIKLFADDLDKALEKSYGKKYLLGTEKEKPGADEALYKYVKESLSIQIDGQVYPLKWLGRDNEGKAEPVIWLYVYAENVSKVSSIQVNNELLTELFSDQSNLVHVKVQKQTKSMYLSKSNHKAVLVFP